MPTVRIPLVGTYNERGIDGTSSLAVPEDQRFLNCVFSVVQNPVTGKATVYVEKRPGWGVDSIVSANNPSTGLIKPLTYTTPVSAFGDTDSTIYVGSTSVGTITGRALHFKETLVSSVSHVMIKSSDGTGWYYVAGAKDQLSYTGNRTSGSAVISGIASTAGMYSGQAISGTGIPAGTRILTVDSGTQITLNANATSGAGTSTTLTKEPIAKILDSDFITTGNYISSFEEMDGFLFYVTDDGNLRNSDLNSVIAYTNTNYVAAQISPDPAVGVVRQKNYLIVFGTASKEAFINGGNATGSPLQRVPQGFENIGALDQRSIKSMEDVVYFVSTPRNGDVGVYRIKALQAEKISPPNIDKIIGTFTATGGSVYTNAFRLGGYPYIGLFISTATEGPASSMLSESGDGLLLETGDNILLESASSEVSSFVRFLVYNIGLNIWSEWDCSEATFVEGGSGGVANVLWATSRVETGGKIYTINPAANGELWRDDGSSYSMEIRTSRIDHGTNKRKYVHEIRLVADKQSTGTVTLEKSDDDYATWQTIGTFDLTSDMDFHIARCGSYKGGRAYKITHSANAPFRAEAIEIDYSVES